MSTEMTLAYRFGSGADPMSVGSRIESKMKKNYTSNVEFFFCLAELKYTTNKFALRSVTVGSLFVRKFQHDEDTTCVSRYY